MAKPIFIIRLPKTEARKEREITNSLKITFPKLYKEYHILVVFSTDTESIQFEAFNPKDIPDIDIEKLKEILNAPNTNI